jgi:hypothetical protein
MYTPQRKTLTNITRTLLTSVYVRPTYASYGRSPYAATFHTDPTELDRFTAPEKKCSRLHLSARLSGLRDPPQFLSQHNNWSSALKSNTCRQQATKLIGPISPVCDRYVQYLLTGTNPSVLNRHRRELSHRNPQNSHNTCQPFHSEGSTDPLNGPAWSQIIRNNYHLSIALLMVSHHKMGVTRIN